MNRREFLCLLSTLPLYIVNFSQIIVNPSMANPFMVKRNVYWLVRTPAQISEEALRYGLPKDTWALSWFNGPLDQIMTPPPPDVPAINRGWKWAMFQRDALKFGIQFAQEYKHLKDGHYHPIPKGKQT